MALFVYFLKLLTMGTWRLDKIRYSHVSLHFSRLRHAQMSGAAVESVLHTGSYLKIATCHYRGRIQDRFCSISRKP